MHEIPVKSAMLSTGHCGEITVEGSVSLVKEYQMSKILTKFMVERVVSKG